MPVIVSDDKFSFVRLELLPDEVGELLEKHVEKYPGAAAVERLGAALIVVDFQPAEAKHFAESVVLWGKGQRFVGRLLSQNTPDELAEALRDADALLQSGNTTAAVSRLQRLRYLGQSFASKMARFMRPNAAVILDEVIRSALGYQESHQGYQEFLDDCRVIHANIASHHPQLRLCDVEAAIFAKIQGY